MIFKVSGTTAYDGLEFGFEEEIEAKDEIEAKAKAIFRQLRGDLHLGWESLGGKSVTVRAYVEEDDEVATFFALYQGENRVEDWDYGDGMAIHRIYDVREAPRTIPAEAIAPIIATLKGCVLNSFDAPLAAAIAELEALL